jgi:hypothetical protein
MKSKMKTATNAKRHEFLRASGQVLSSVMAAIAATAALADTAKPTLSSFQR